MNTRRQPVAIARFLLSVLALAAMVSCGPKSTPIQDSKITAVGTAASPTHPTSGSALPQILATPLPDDPMGVTIHRLSNGLTVYLSPDHSTPSVSAWIAVRAGSRHDPADSTGLAHYLEHMLFKGSSRLGTLDFATEKASIERVASLYDQLRTATDATARAQVLAQIDAETQKMAAVAVPNEFDNLYAGLGVSGVNAFTSDEQTVYIAEVPTNRLAAWANVEGERFRDPQFRLFYPELESVYEEKNRSLDSPVSRIYEAMARGLYPEHPYGTQPTIGLSEHLKTPAYADMVEYFDTWYRPNNMAIVLAGDVSAEETLPLLEKHFGALVAKELPELPAASTAPPAERQDIEIVAPGEQSIYIAWPTVPAGHPDESALEVMDLLMDNAKTGLLNLELVLSQKLPQAGSFGSQMSEAGNWVLYGTARDDQSLADVESLLVGVVGKLKQGEFTQADLDAILINREISEKLQLEQNGARVSQMTSAFIERRDWHEVVDKPKRLQKVTPQDVVRVANRYLTDAPVVVKRVRGDYKAPKVEKPKITPIAIDSSRRSDFAKSIYELPAKDLEPEWLVEKQSFERLSLPAGPFIAVRNPRNDLFELSYQFDLGSWREPLLCFALSLAERSGTQELAPPDLQKKLYSMGTDIDFFCDAQSTTIRLSGIDRNLEASVALLRTWLEGVKPPPGTLDKLLANTVSERKDEMNEPSAVAQAASEYALFGKSSSFLRVTSNKALAAAKETRLVGLVQRLADHQHRTSYFGPRSAQDVTALIALGKQHKKVSPPEKLVYRNVKKPTIFLVEQPTSQAQIRIAWPAGDLQNEQRLDAEIFSQYVGGGMGALVFQEIREARGLAYSAWARFMPPSKRGDQSALVAGMGTQVDKTVEALSTMLALLAPLAVENTRFAGARDSLVAEYRSTRVPPRHRAGWVFDWDRLGMTEDPRPTRFAALTSKEADDLQSFAHARTKTSPIIAITGNPARFDLKALGHIATIEKVQPRQLFGY